jgi:exonuclease SbcD
LLRLLHTSDWHLGRRLYDISCASAHRRFLNWLLDTLEAERIDVLLVAGDIFDQANPPADALRLYYDFLGECARRFTSLDVVIVGGNHDSPARLDAPSALATALGIRVVGGLPRDASGMPLPDQIIIPVTDASGAVAARVLAVPFVRLADLRQLPGAGHAARLRALYHSLAARAEAIREPDQAIIAMGHLYTVGGELSELSERRIQQGYIEAVSAELFPPSISYAALGHLHRAQRVAGQERLAYSGSPLPMAFPERAYPHQVRLVVLDGPVLQKTVPLRVPAFIRLEPIPVEHQPIDVVLGLLEAVPASEEGETGDPPLIEVRVALDHIEPELRSRVEEALHGRHAQLVRIDAVITGQDQPLAEQLEERRLERLDPNEVFAACWRRRFAEDIPDDLHDRFARLLEQVQGGDEGGAP